MRNDVLGQGDRPVPAVGRTVRFRTIARPLLKLTASALLLLFLLFFPRISAAQESSDPPLNHAHSERRPFFSDVTIWSAQTVGSVNVMSTIRGRRCSRRALACAPPVQLSAYDPALELRGHTGVHAVVPRRKRTDLSLRWRRGVGFGFRAAPTMAGRPAVYRREFRSVGVHNADACGHEKDELLTAIRPGIEVPVARQKFPEDRDHIFPFFEYAHRKQQSRV